MSDVEMDDGAGAEVDLTNQDAITKYKAAGDIVNKTLAGLMVYAKPGMKVVDCCAFGDSLITQQCAMIYKAKKIEKGIAFPTCVSLNDCVCHYSPLPSDSETVLLKVGDVVKVDLGCHVDGFIAVAAHTFVVREENDTAPITGPKADVIKAAYLAAEAGLRLIKPGNTNAQVTEIFNKAASDFGVNTVQGVLMHELKQFVIDGNNVIIEREEIEQKVDTFEFEASKVYTVDVFMSTGEGKPIVRDARTTVFKRAVDQEYKLKMKASRYVIGEVNKKFSTFPFTIRALEDERQARMGVTECIKHNLFHTYPVLWEKPNDIVAHFKFTLLMLASGTNKLTGGIVNLEEYQSDKTVSEELQKVLDIEPTKSKKKAAASTKMET